MVNTVYIMKLLFLSLGHDSVFFSLTGSILLLFLLHPQWLQYDRVSDVSRSLSSLPTVSTRLGGWCHFGGGNSRVVSLVLRRCLLSPPKKPERRYSTRRHNCDYRELHVTQLDIHGTHGTGDQDGQRDREWQLRWDNTLLRNT